jgi:hypothetical protein
MMTATESWLILLGAGLGLAAVMGLALAGLSRAPRVRCTVMSCPESGLPVVVQDLTGDGGHVTRVVTCRAFPDARPITCGLTCLARESEPVADRRPVGRLDA